MSPEAQRIAIAEACGWTDISTNPFTPNPPHCGFHLSSGRTQEANSGSKWGIPDYLNDLNAMHEAVDAVLLGAGRKGDWRGWDSYIATLAEMEGTEGAIEATAAQRAEAFLRTLSKWEDGK